MGTHEYPWIPQYSRVPAQWVPTRVQGGHEYHIYPMGRRQVSYYPYPWVPIDIPKFTPKGLYLAFVPFLLVTHPLPAGGALSKWRMFKPNDNVSSHDSYESRSTVTIPTCAPSTLYKGESYWSPSQILSILLTPHSRTNRYTHPAVPEETTTPKHHIGSHLLIRYNKKLKKNLYLLFIFCDG